MSRDLLFNGEVVVDPREALLYQGNLWGISTILDVPRMSVPAFISYDVEPDEFMHATLEVSPTQTVETFVTIVTSFSGGEVISINNRNIQFQTRALPSLTWRKNIIIEDGVSFPSSNLYPALWVKEVPEFIVSGVHVAIGFINSSLISNSRVAFSSLFHVQPNASNVEP